MEIPPTEISQGENDYQEVHHLIDQTEIDPTETSQEDNDYEEVRRLRAKLSDGAQKTEFFFSSACIYRVPKHLRKLKGSAYTPRLIAIGPLHRNDKHLQTPMRHVKLSYANNLLCRVSQVMEGQESAEQKKLTVLRECMEAIKASLDNAEKCYLEEVTLNVEMMLVDGCFILEFLYRYFWQVFDVNSEGTDPIFENASTLITIEHDLLLLENQIPFLVLERLLPLTLARIPNLLHTQIPLLVFERLLPHIRARIPNLLHKNLSLTDYVFLPGVDQLMRPTKGNPTNSGSTKSCWPRNCILWVLGNKMNNAKHKEKVPTEEVVSSEKEDSTYTGTMKTSCWPRDCILWLSGNKMNNSKPEEKVPSEEVVSSEKEDSTNTGSTKTSCWPRDCILWVSGNKMNNPEEKVPSKDDVSGEQEVSSGNSTPYHHILHKLHDDYLPQDQIGKGEAVQKETGKGEHLTEELPSASELVYAGVKFIRGGDDLFKVKFTEPTGLFWWYHRARFEIPFLEIDDSTESVLRNLIAFKQCCPTISQHFTSYAILIDMLVNYDKDVQVLEKAGVLRNCLGAAEDVTKLFNKLAKEVSYGEFFFADTCNRAIRYRKHFWPTNMAYVRSKYFASPWTFIAFCLGFIAFGITITNFIRSSLHKPL